jgi:hypothetical protein
MIRMKVIYIYEILAEGIIFELVYLNLISSGL